MRKILSQFLFFALGSWLLAFSGTAQTYPVTVNVFWTQPSPIYLSNYANAASVFMPIKISLNLNDLSIANRQVRLKCYLQGNGIALVNNNFVVGETALMLNGGFPLQLTQQDVAPYFEYQNLQGITPNIYSQPLPEGVYTFSVEVYDFITGQKISAKTSTSIVFFQNEPPFLNLPQNQSSFQEQPVQNIVFNWTPRQINVSNVEYELSLVEIWDKNSSFQNAFLNSVPFYTTTTRNTSLMYGLAQPQLLPGKRYAWRVQARALVGAESIGAFKNNGYSEVFMFDYEIKCNPPININTESVSQNQAKITWTGAIDNYDYQVQYREKNADSNWYTLETPRQFAAITSLKPNTDYEYTVGASCELGKYVPSSIQTFTTLAENELAAASCGISPDPVDLSNLTPLPELHANDVVTAGDFPIVVIKATGSNGSFSGEGYVTLPFLERVRKLIDAADAVSSAAGKSLDIGKYSRIKVQFANVGINTDFKLISGEFIASYDAKGWVTNMADLDALSDSLMGDDGKVTNISVDFEIASVVKNNDGSFTITSSTGVVVNEPAGAVVKVYTDSNGKQYTLDPKGDTGNVKSSGEVAQGGVPTSSNTSGMSSSGNAKTITATDVSITFDGTASQYSYDVAPTKTDSNSQLYNSYETIDGNDGTKKPLGYKAIADAPFTTDIITAKAVFSNGKTAKDVVFKTNKGTRIPTTWTGTTATLTLTKNFDFGKEQLLATIKPAATADSTKTTDKYQLAAALNLWHFKAKKVNVTLVSLNGAPIPTEAQTYLNEVYNKAGIEFVVTPKNLNFANTWGKTIQTGDSDLLNTYTDGQQLVTQAVMTALGSEYKTDTYYMLYTNEKASNSDAGFMPLLRQFGFVFNGANRTLAHELGHGVFGLKHPFNTKADQGKTNLLMDYGEGELLSHNDWGIMHAPGLQLYQFTQGSSAGAQIAEGFNYIMPNYKSFRFQTNDGKKDSDIINVDHINNGGHPNGTLYAFNINGKEYEFGFDSKKATEAFYEKGSDIPYNNAYNTTFEEQNYRLLIQQAANSCNYYLAIRKKPNLLNPVLTILPAEVPTPISNCSKILLNETSVNAGNIDCSRINYVSTIVPKHITQVINAINNSKNKKVNIKSTILSSKKYVLKIGDGNLPDEKILDNLEDKFRLLAEKTGKNLYFVPILHDTLTNSSHVDVYSKITVEKIAKEAFENANLGENDALIVFPFSNNLHDTKCYPFGIAKKGNSVVEDQDITNLQGSWTKKILTVFANISKPVFINSYFLSATGRLIHFTNKTDNVKGYSSINLLNFYESKGYDEAKQLNDELNKCRDVVLNLPCSEVWEKYQLYNDRLNTLSQKYANLELKDKNFQNTSIWKKISSDDIGKFREVFIDDIPLTNAIWVGSKEKWTWGYKFQIATNFSSTLNTQHFYNNIRAAVLDDVVYSTLDGIGVIPGIDSFADAAGAIYAGVRKDRTNFITYSASLAIPFAGSIYLKAGAHEAKELWGIVAKKANNADGFVLEARRIDEILPNEFHISSISYGNEKELTEKILLEATADVNNYVDKKIVNEALDDLAVQSTAFFKKIEALTNLTAAEKTTLKSLLEADASLAKAFAKAPEEMAGAWKLVRSSIAEGTQFAKDPKTLEKLAEMMQTNSAFRQKLGNSWENKLSELLGKHNHLRCSTCGNAGIKAAPEMHEFLSDVEHFYVNFNQNGKANKFFNWLNRQTAGAGDAADIATNNANTSLAEMYQTLKQLRKNGIKEADVKQFGVSYSNLPNSRQSDILLNNGKHIELKNKPYAIDGTFTAQEIDQVIGTKGAFGNIDKLDDFEWIAELSRGNEATNLKKMWKKVFENNADNMFKSVDEGGLGLQKMKQLFGTPQFNFNNSTQFKTLLNNNEAFRNNILKFIKSN